MTANELKERIQTQYVSLARLMEDVVSHGIHDAPRIKHQIKLQLSRAHTELVYSYDMLDDETDQHDQDDAVKRCPTCDEILEVREHCSTCGWEI